MLSTLIMCNLRCSYKYRVLVKLTPQMREGDAEGGSKLIKVKNAREITKHLHNSTIWEGLGRHIRENQQNKIKYICKYRRMSPILRRPSWKADLNPWEGLWHQYS